MNGEVMKRMESKLLPIGSVVKLKGEDEYFIIAGYLPQGSPEPDYVYDYSGFPYPLGYTGVFDVFQFDCKQVEQVIAMGYQDTEQMNFMEKLETNFSDFKHKKQI